MELAIILNLLLSLFVIPYFIGSKRKIGYGLSALACLFLTPIIGLIITLSSKRIE